MTNPKTEKQMPASNEEIVEVEYDKAKLYKRWFSTIIDIVLTIILGIFLYALCSLIVTSTPSYQNMIQERNALQIDSGLYNEENTLYILITSEDEDSTYLEKKNLLNDSIETFYHNENFFSQENNEYYQAYQQRKKDYINDSGHHIFVEDSSNLGFYNEDSQYLDEDFYLFYYAEIDDYCVGYLSLNETYNQDTRCIFRLFVIELVIGFTISFFVFFILIPLCLKRGHKTIGMYLFKIGLISSGALNLTYKQFWIRSLWVFLIGFALNIVTVFIPLLVSITMMHLSKAGQDFFDYMSNSYVVDVSKRDIYLDYHEYEQRKGLSNKAKIDDNNLKLHP